MDGSTMMGIYMADTWKRKPQRQRSLSQTSHCTAVIYRSQEDHVHPYGSDILFHPTLAAESRNHAIMQSSGSVSDIEPWLAELVK
ncbi:hypothetical protein BFJ66_g4503 [Fusarium oxysporum f. sp. cepae]|uniref:Uncharacterized protein n=1 Tax=Fusarium oxysporum f. sp. cepae TaxID=396571 RepID=A0A3L6NGQ4_FUSOX|nr:hypothetical protein H9L39_10385 [Fusarium oxysporum f. sp. albedinis]RKK16625.1 hypothetical protein BFJ65_g10187 [Fusarium oxysporum f. sp. cepae]RKK54616.1 hypothetical protein BFJ66_g4503 [Fusarium oxysporum f. sp. cepae]